MASPGPITASERVPLFDVLRGVALYGVLLANTAAWYSGAAFLPQAERAASSTRVDQVARFGINLLVDGKAMSLLTFLFGLGFALQMERPDPARRTPTFTYVRRMLALAFLGVCHVTLLWWGDILWGYAIGGLGLLFFRRVSLRGLFFASLALMVIPVVVATAPPVAARLEAILPGPADHEAFRAQLVAALRGHDFIERARMQALEALYYTAAILPWYFFWLVGRFTLGYWAGKSRRLHEASAHLPFFRKLLYWGVGVGLAGSALTAARRLLDHMGIRPSPWAMFALLVPADFGHLAVAGAYLSAIVLLMERPAWRARLMVFAPVGRMPLTTYIGQSLIGTALFYGWGLGLFGRVGTAMCVPITLAIFAAQIALSRAWLRRFRFGPVEWVWRSLTYGRLPPMRL